MVLIFRKYEKLVNFLKNKKQRDELGAVKSIKRLNGSWMVTLLCPVVFISGE